MPKSVIKKSVKKVPNPYTVRDGFISKVENLVAGMRRMKIQSKSPAKKPSPVKKTVSPVKKSPVKKTVIRRKTVGTVKKTIKKRDTAMKVAHPVDPFESLVKKMGKTSVKRVKRDDGIDTKNIVQGKRRRN